MPLTPELTYAALLAVQAAHLLHHRMAKRHISFAEVISAGALCIPPSTAVVPTWLLISMHGVLIAVQVVGSLYIQRLSPNWVETGTPHRGG